MNNIPIQQDDVTELSAADFNSLVDELKKFIDEGNQNLPGPNNQLANTLASFVSMADFYIDNGGAPDVYNLAPANANIGATQFFDGMRVRFFPLFCP